MIAANSHARRTLEPLIEGRYLPLRYRPACAYSISIFFAIRQDAATHSVGLLVSLAGKISRA